MRRSLTERRMRSPFRTWASGPPAAASGRHVQHDRAIGGAAHPRVRNAHHVLDPGARELLRDRQIAGLGHPRSGERPGILQHQEIVRGHVEAGIVDARRQILERGKDDRPPLLLEQFRVGGRALEDRALGRQRAEQRDEPAHGLQRVGERLDHGAVDRAGGCGEPLAPRSRRSRSGNRGASSGCNSRNTAPMPPAANRSSM